MREPGFYWVSYNGGPPEVARFEQEQTWPNGWVWFLSGSEVDERETLADGERLSDCRIEVLSERLEPPGDLAATRLERATGELFRAAKAERIDVRLRFVMPRVAKKKKAKKRASKARR